MLPLSGYQLEIYTNFYNLNAEVTECCEALQPIPRQESTSLLCLHCTYEVHWKFKPLVRGPE
jgi:hypothetical protein